MDQVSRALYGLRDRLTDTINEDALDNFEWSELPEGEKDQLSGFIARTTDLIEKEVEKAITTLIGEGV